MSLRCFFFGHPETKTVIHVRTKNLIIEGRCVGCDTVLAYGSDHIDLLPEYRQIDDIEVIE